MDLNQLLHRHQISLMRAADAGCVEARISHQGLAALYAKRIANLVGKTGAPVNLA